ncbi:MAG: hypothetical protein JSW20_05135 [Nitrospiraceae bacterium]|nr:MAG: hypothetical protein JSW20_05135 [Nitrospiraceae bacterium]
MAECHDTIVIESNQYFPSSSIRKEYFQNSETHIPLRGKGKPVTIT